MAVGIEQNIQKKTLSFKETVLIGFYCGISTGIFSLILWYGILSHTKESFDWFFTHASGKTLIATIAPVLWQYGLIHFFACIPLSILGSSCSYSIQERSQSWDF